MTKSLWYLFFWDYQYFTVQSPNSANMNTIGINDVKRVNFKMRIPNDAKLLILHFFKINILSA